MVSSAKSTKTWNFGIPKLRLEEAGFATKLAGEELRVYTGKNGYPATADLLVSKAKSEDYAGLLIPGGFMPDKLRRNADVLRLTREFHQQGKLIAFICHGGWIPISAKILKGKRVTGTVGHQGRSGKCRRRMGR